MYRLTELDEDHINIIDEEMYDTAKEAINRMLEIARNAAKIAFDDVLKRFEVDEYDKFNGGEKRIF